eukprot:235604-Hanusia_phi.AAC.1
MVVMVMVMMMMMMGRRSWNGTAWSELHLSRLMHSMRRMNSKISQGGSWTDDITEDDDCDDVCSSVTVIARVTSVMKRFKGERT